VTGDPHVRDQFPYPRGDIVAGFLDEAAFDGAREHLEQAGFGPGAYEVLHGERDAARVDITGQAHGLAGSIFRRLQAAMTDEAELARRYAEHLRGGHYLVAVSVGDDEAAKQRAAAALRAAHAQFLSYYATNYIEDLGADS
jgi:hypothetical protein